jgi:O-acetyl-ADP-ribose deacetylase (regulator of RNase III)
MAARAPVLLFADPRLTTSMGMLYIATFNAMRGTADELAEFPYSYFKRSAAVGVLMADPVRIFICYKKILSREQDGQKVIQRNTEAGILQYLLNQSTAYDSWVDVAGLTAGMKWETEIYRQLLASDVVIVLIGPGTSSSEWVRREIALANALGVAMVPVGFDVTDQQMLDEAKALSIDDLQWIVTRNIDLRRGAALIAELREAIETACEATQVRQQAAFSQVAVRRTPARSKAADNQRAASFELVDGAERVVLHVASGDISRIRGVDVLVNSENDYMQMARFFESRTVSSMLRRRGARIKDNRYQDTIQEELDWRLRDRGRPVQVAEVFATSAGGPHSDLARQNKARVILHVAAVQAVDAEARVVPYKEPHQIEACVRNALTAMAELSDLEGVFSPQGSDQYIEQQRRADAGSGRLASIVFPLLGTGQGGASAAEVIDPMIDAMIDFLSSDDDRDGKLALKEIYVATYTQDDTDVVISNLTQRFGSALRAPRA